jgi:RHS repeat-associated protein
MDFASKSGRSSHPVTGSPSIDSGVTSFEVEYRDGAGWAAAAGAANNALVWRRVEFSPVTTARLRVRVTGALAGHSRLAEVEAWGPDEGAQVRWLVTDQLGTPRMVFDRTGGLAGVTRHDYLPFGEELKAGGRTEARGYGVGGGERQRFAGSERDAETGLDFMQARYYSSAQGRFISVDPAIESASGTTPQSWNRYAYAFNNPLRYVDPLGLWSYSIHYEYHETGKKKGQVKSATLTFTKTPGKNDDAASLVKQLGYKPGDAGYDNLLKRVTQTLGVADSIQSSRIGGVVGRFFGVIESKLADQREYDRTHPGTTGGPADPDYQDCSMTASRLAYPVQMAARGAGGVGNNNFGVDEADEMNARSPEAPLDALRVRDVIRYGQGDRRHFASVIFTGDDGIATVFSRTGLRGRFETLKVNEPKILNGYGKITGSFRP